MKEPAVKKLLEEKQLTWQEFTRYMTNKTITNTPDGIHYNIEDVNWFLISQGREVFYRIKGTFGHNIQILTCNGHDLLEAITSASSNDGGKVIKTLVEKLVIVNDFTINESIMRELSVNDMGDIMEVIGKQMGKYNFQQ